MTLFSSFCHDGSVQDMYSALHSGAALYPFNMTKPETDIEIITPIIHLSKSEIVKKTFELKAPLELSWSCYKNNDIACGVCDSCVLRLKGFQLAGQEDPIPYIKRPLY